MKIKYDMSNNYWNCHNEAQAIVMMRKKLQKNPNRKIRNLFYSGGVYGIGIVIVSLCYLLFRAIKIEEIFLTVLSDFIIFLVIFLILYFVLIILTYVINHKKSSHKGTLEIDEKGLKDISDNGKETFVSWENIKLVGIKKYTITFVTNTKIVVFVNIENKKDILKALQTYQSNLLVID